MGANRPEIRIDELGFVATPEFLSPRQLGAHLHRSRIASTRSTWPHDLSMTAFLYRRRGDGDSARRLSTAPALGAALDQVAEIGRHLPCALDGYFSNGGEHCWLVPVELDDHAVIDTAPLAALDDVATVCFPDLWDELPAPDLAVFAAAQHSLIRHCESAGDRLAVLDCPPDLVPQQAREWRLEIAEHDSPFAALYYPRVEVVAPEGAAFDGHVVASPPCGHVAGVLARVDRFEGVHRAPSNELIRGAVDVTPHLTIGERSVLNPIGLNAIVAAGTKGIRLIGARTLASDVSFRMVQTRRLLNALVRMIRVGTRWVHDAADDETIRAQLEHDIGALCQLLWRSGALTGQTADEAFSVVSDLGDARAAGDTDDIALFVTVSLVHAGPQGLRVTYRRSST